MSRTLLRRLALSVPLFFVVTLLTFLLPAFIPGGAAEAVLGTSATPDKIAALNQQLGLNDPVFLQYWRWLKNALGGNLGNSLANNESVTQILKDAFPVTLSLILGAMVIAMLLGIPIGVVSARRARSGGAGGQVIDALSLTGYAIPNYFLGIMAGFLFSNVLHVLPASGYTSPAASLTDWFKSIVLPVLTLGLPGAALLARQTRQSMVEVLARDYIRSLRGRGLSERSIIYKHALRNAMGNVVTMLGIYVVSLLLGTILIENVFAMQGIGTVAVTATSQHDLPTIEGAAMYLTIVVVVAFILIDLIRAWLNPKLRSDSGRT